MFARIVVAAAVAAGFCAEARAQYFPGNRERREQPKLEPFQASGTVAAVARGQIKMVTATQQNWIVNVIPQAMIHVTGTAEPDYLQVGHFVRFNAALDKKGKAQEPVGELTIYTPSAELGMGVWPEGMAVGDVGAEHAQPQPAPNPFGGQGFGVGNPGAGNPGVAPPASNRYMVAGRITGNRKGKLIVNFGRGVTEIELTENPSVNVDFADYSVAQQGDAITISKGQTHPAQFEMMANNPNMVGQAIAQALEIQLTQPLAARQKKPVRPEPVAPERPAPARPGQPEQPPAAGPDGAPGQGNPFGDPAPLGG